MAPREIGGVVDPELKVYGTKNLRVVDASVLPLQLGATPMSTIYAIAEKVSSLVTHPKSSKAD
jgi:choline dehydrogenase-like flavoprotein